VTHIQRASLDSGVGGNENAADQKFDFEEFLFLSSLQCECFIKALVNYVFKMF